MKKYKRIFVWFLLLGFMLFSVNFISGYFGQRVAVYVKQKAILNTSLLIEETIKKEVLPTIDIENLIKLNTDDNKKVQNVIINTKQINEILANINNSLYDSIKKIEDKIELNNMTLPFGIIISDTLFGDVGPNFRIKIYPLGSVKSDVVTSMDDYGINSSILKIDIVVKINFMTVIPLNKEDIEVVTKVPIVVQIINSEVPRYYYYGDLSNAPVDFD